MLSPRHQHYADRIRQLIDEGEALVALEIPTSSEVSSYIQDTHQIPLQAWLVKTFNIIDAVFGPQSQHIRRLADLAPESYGIGGILFYNQIHPIVGLLAGALDDLEKGYLLGQEFLLAGEVFDSVLEQARHLNQTGHKDPAAVLGRVVLEDALRRIARAENLDHTQSASRLNDSLREAGRYPQPQWRQVQAWLDIGNAAAHGRFNEYTQEQVDRLLDDIEGFLATELRP